MTKTTLLITVEHGGNKVPVDYDPLFAKFEALLQTHRGLDIGIWDLSETFKNLSFPMVKLFRTDITRLLVDVNRSLWRRTLFSEVTKALSKAEKEMVLERYYFAYRNPIYTFVNSAMLSGQKIIHVALHSFTANLNGEVRNTDIGLLFNPQRKNEKQFCTRFKKEITVSPLKWRVRFNYPYRGKPDGLNAHFRNLYPDNKYLGIEFEVNQKYANLNRKFPKKICDYLSDSLDGTLNHFEWVK